MINTISNINFSRGNCPLSPLKVGILTSKAKKLNPTRIPLPENYKQLRQDYFQKHLETTNKIISEIKK